MPKLVSVTCSEKSPDYYSFLSCIDPHPPGIQTLKGDEVEPGSVKLASPLAKVSKGPQNYSYYLDLMSSLAGAHSKTIGV